MITKFQLFQKAVWTTHEYLNYGAKRRLTKLANVFGREWRDFLKAVLIHIRSVNGTSTRLETPPAPNPYQLCLNNKERILMEDCFRLKPPVLKPTPYE